MASLSAIAPLCALFAFIFAPAPVDAVELAYCSSQNTGSQFNPQSSTFQSNGLCTQTCSAEYVFAVLLGKQCWCSDYVPAETTNVDDCNSPCPGYPSDKCGNANENYFAYIQISSRVPSGTTTGSIIQATSSSTTTTSGSSTSTSFHETTVTVTASASRSSTTTTLVTTLPMTTLLTSTTAPTTTTAPTNTSPVLSVQTIAGQATTITVVGADPATSTPSPAVHKGSSGLSGGAIAGIVIGTLLGVAALAASGLWFWFVGRRRQPEPAPSPDSRYDDPSVQNGLLGNRRQSKASQMSLMPNFFASDQEKPPVSPTSGGPAFIDNRMKKDAVLYPHGSRHSTVSLRDDQDYSRPVLRLTNPD